MISSQVFTLEEANAIVAEVKPMMADLLMRRARVMRDRALVADVAVDGLSDVGSAAASAMVQDFIKIERLAQRIRDYGCELKDINVGLLDFLAEHNGRQVYLCWRYGEESISYYHDVSAGFQGRQPL